MDTKQKGQVGQPRSIQPQHSDSDVWDEKEDSIEDIASLLEGLPLPRTSTISLSDHFDILPEAKAGLVTVTSSRRLTETYDQLLSTLRQMTQKCDRLLSDVNSICIRLQALEQKQDERIEKMAEHQSHFQHHDDRPQIEAENRSNNFKPVMLYEDFGLSSERLAAVQEDSATQAGNSATAPVCFLLEFYPRPGNVYSGRIHHTLSNQATSFKGQNFQEILPFIKKYLQPAESDAGDQPMVNEPALTLPAEPAEQVSAVIEPQPKPAPEVECCIIREIGLIQDGQKTVHAPFRLQARKRFAVVLNLELPISQQDAIKTNYMLRYDVEIKARHLLDNRMTCQSLQHGGMNSKGPKDIRAFYLEAFAPGNYVLDIRIVMPQKNISEQMQLEINVV